MSDGTARRRARRSARDVEGRIPVLYLAPWVDYGGTAKGTLDWFRWLDRERFAPSLILTQQPSQNRLLADVVPFAEEIWNLPEVMPGGDMPHFIADFVHSRGVRVVHIMNSRLGFELMPDLRCLPAPPVIVVQLHVEEDTRGGYVRYAATRYGNLAGGFSVTSEHLAATLVDDYDVSPAKCNVIHTGVDADGEFSPERVTAIPGLPDGVLHILYLGRLIRQKDPQLMVHVAEELRARTQDFQIHVVGYGPMETEIRELVRARRLTDHVVFHGATHEPAPWYAACDVLLMTSIYEGIPYVLFEAMAMEVPVVAPALPGMLEVVDAECGRLVQPRADPVVYADALLELQRDPALRRRLGGAARERARGRYGLREMATAHEQLYIELLGGSTASGIPVTGSRAAARPQPIALRDRSGEGQPLVTVIIRCFNHGRYLLEGLETVRGQDYPAVEIVVVDDGSDDAHTAGVIDELDDRADVMVIRHPSRRGPAAALNTGVSHASGRYILPLDADNKLLPNALADLVRQINAAPPSVGFIYPNVQFFGNRHDSYEPPAYNLYALLKRNYCDMCALIDRDVFDAGVRYDDALFREDWHLWLDLAARKVYGERSRTRTFLLRKRGFNRSDLVGHANGGDEITDATRARHPELLGSTHARAAVKAAWLPALSIIAVQPAADDGVRRDLAGAIGRQSCIDAEVLVFGEAPATGEPGPCVRALAVPRGTTPGYALSMAIAEARGRFVLVTAGNGMDLLRDPGFVEKLLRAFAGAPTVGAMTFSATTERMPPWRLIEDRDAGTPRAHAVAWAIDRLQNLRQGVEIPAGPAVAGLAAELSRRTPTQRRALAAGARDLTLDEALAVSVSGATSAWLKANAGHRPLEEAPLLPTVPLEEQRPVRVTPWQPPQSRRLFRHVHPPSGMRLINSDSVPPPGCSFEFCLGTVKIRPLPGTVRLDARGGLLDPHVRYDAQEETAPAHTARPLGFIEASSFPMLARLSAGVLVETGQEVLVAGADDPLAGRIADARSLGFIEPSPLYPRAPGTRAPEGTGEPVEPVGLLTLVRGIHANGRRHAYAVDQLPSGTPVGELGSLQLEPRSGSAAVWLTDGGVLYTDDYKPARRRPHLGEAARWTLSPLRWHEFSSGPGRLMSVLRRAGAAARHLVLRAGPRVPRKPAGRPIGYLRTAAEPDSIPLFAASHPVVGDQLLTPWPDEPAKMGYDDPLLLGYLMRPPNGAIAGAFRSVPVPWAWQFGRAAAAVRGLDVGHRFPVLSPAADAPTSPVAEAVDESAVPAAAPSAADTAGAPSATRVAVRREAADPISVGAVIGAVSPQIRAGRIEGWACDPRHPDRHCEVQLVEDDRVLAEDIANQVTAGWAGEGKEGHGFSFPIPQQCFDPGVHELEVIAKDGGARLGEAVQIRHHTGGERVLSAVQQPELNLAVEGWVFDPGAPEERFTVSVFIDRQFVGQAAARRNRDDLRRLGYSDGRLGYGLEIPERYLDGDTHVIHVLINERGFFARKSGIAFWRDTVAEGLLRRMGRRLDAVSDLLE